MPHHAFVDFLEKLMASGPTFEERQRLISVIVRSDSIPSLETACEMIGCVPLQGACVAAAAEGANQACEWLIEQGAPHDDFKTFAEGAAAKGIKVLVQWALERAKDRGALVRVALVAAAGAGQADLSSELLATRKISVGADCCRQAACKAAEGGHEELMNAVLRTLPSTEASKALLDPALLLCGGYGFGRPALHRLCAAATLAAAEAEGGGVQAFRDAVGSELAFGAFFCLTWLEAEGFHLAPSRFNSLERLPRLGWGGLAQLPDALNRLAALRERGLLNGEACLRDAIVATGEDNDGGGGGLHVVRYLLSEGLLPAGLRGQHWPTELAAEAGNVEIMQELLAAGFPIRPNAVRKAAHRGREHVLLWMAEPAPPAAAAAAAAAYRAALCDETPGRELATCVAESGNTELVMWLLEQGCPAGECTFKMAARAGGLRLLRFLHDKRCPMTADAYVLALNNDDLAVLRCLRELDCPWGQLGRVFANAVWDPWSCHGCSLAVLRWLVAAGCPVDWRWARNVARFRPDVPSAEVREWVAAQAAVGAGAVPP